MDFLEGMAKRFVPFTGYRVLEIPHQDFLGEGHERHLAGGFVAQGDQVVEVLSFELIEGLAVQAGSGDADVIEGVERAWVYLGCRYTGAERIEVFGVGMLKKRFRYQGARIIVCADEQHSELVSHSHFYLIPVCLLIC
ncbi:hypothetical protein D9M68_950740 [compost metagenome]